MKFNYNTKIFVAGHNGLVGSAIVRKLKEKGYTKILTANRSKLDLTNQQKVFNFLKKNQPKFIFVAAAKVGGIYSNNKYKAEFIHNNLSIQNNIIHSAYLCGIKDLIFLGSSCVYPRNAKQPIKEEYILTGKLEKTNDAYAIAKIAGIQMCASYNHQYKTNYKCLMPTNTFGINDNYDDLNSHFFPALIKKIIDAIKKNNKYITIWGDGNPKRELIFSYDLADAIIFFLNKKTKENIINIGTKDEKSIYEFTQYIMKFLKVNLKIKFKNKNLKGTFRKKLDTKLAKKYGWVAKTNLSKGLSITISDYLEHNILKKL